MRTPYFPFHSSRDTVYLLIHKFEKIHLGYCHLKTQCEALLYTINTTSNISIKGLLSISLHSSSDLSSNWNIFLCQFSSLQLWVENDNFWILNYILWKLNKTKTTIQTGVSPELFYSFLKINIIFWPTQ